MPNLYPLRNATVRCSKCNTGLHSVPERRERLCEYCIRKARNIKD